jgi:hypothetical protein
MWDVLHRVAKVADEEDDSALYLQLLDVYLRGHPCANECRKHLARNLRIVDPNRYISMFSHSVDLHNVVNRQLGKPEFSLQDAYDYYGFECDSCIFTSSRKSQSSGGSQHTDEQSYSTNPRSVGRTGATNLPRVYPSIRRTPSNL